MAKKTLFYSFSIAYLVLSVNSIAIIDKGPLLITHDLDSAPVARPYGDCQEKLLGLNEHTCLSQQNDMVAKDPEDDITKKITNALSALISRNTINEERRSTRNGENESENGNGSGNKSGSGNGRNGNGGSGGSNDSGVTKSSSNSLSTGAKIGIGVGVGLGAIGIVAGMVSFFLRCRGRIRRFQNIQSGQGRGRDIENQQLAKDMYSHNMSYADRYSRSKVDSGTPLVEAPTTVSPGFYFQNQERQLNEMPT